MNLQEFIKMALTEIVVGVADASKNAKEHGGSVGSMELYGYLKENHILTNEKNQPVNS